MRCDQHVGLPPEAAAFLEANEIPVQVCRHCNRPMPRTLKVVGHYSGMFDQQYDLYRHPLKDGGHADEFLQATPWSSGPMFFLGLGIFQPGTKLPSRTITWAEEEIDTQV